MHVVSRGRLLLVSQSGGSRWLLVAWPTIIRQRGWLFKTWEISPFRGLFRMLSGVNVSGVLIIKRRPRLVGLFVFVIRPLFFVCGDPIFVS
jgi:hypothetical protein